MIKRFRVGVALGGGAARAFSHIGVLEGLSRHGIPIDIVTGTSMGAIIGAMYAYQPEVEAIKARFEAYVNSDEFAESGFSFFKELDVHNQGLLAEIGRLARRGVFNALSITKTALVSDKTAARSYALLVEDINIEQTRLPFAAVALDLIQGQTVILDRGPLRPAIAASCAMPGVLNPVEHDGKLLIDGGWAETVPIRAARELGADFVIAVDVGDNLRTFDPPRNAIDVIARADYLARTVLNHEQIKTADFLLSPKNGIKHWADFTTWKQAIACGEDEVNAQIGHLQKMLRRARWKKRLFPWRRS